MWWIIDYEAEAAKLDRLADEAGTPRLRDMLRDRAERYRAVAAGHLHPKDVGHRPERQLRAPQGKWRSPQ